MASKWRPQLSPKQLAQFECDKRFQLLCGPKFSGKTWTIFHDVLRDLWNSPRARFGIITRTTRAGTTGIWPNVTGIAYQEWVDAGICSEDFHFGWAKNPHTDAVTKINRAILRNKYGGESELILFPIDRAEDAEEKMFSTEFSHLWISEAQYYENRSIFDTCRAQLRLPGTRYEDQRLYIDMNPAESGVKHWAYEAFYTERNWTPDQYPEHWNEGTRKAFAEFQNNSAVFEYSLLDNVYADQRQLENVMATYANDPDKYRRFVLGEWLDTSSDALVLKTSFDRNIHVVGDASHPNPDEWEVLAPATGIRAKRSGNRIEMLGGWDPGSLALWQSANHSWCALQEWEDDQGILGFDVLEEHVVLKEAVSLEEFTKAVMEKRAALADFAGTPIVWTDYSDGSTLRFRSEAQDGNVPKEDQTDAGVITAASKGEIRLIGSDKVKAAGWQQRRVNLLSKLLAEKRIRISAHCTNVIGMMENLKKDLSPKAKTYLDMTQPCKHVFDALSYAISMRMLDQLLDEGVPRTRKRRSSFSSV